MSSNEQHHGSKQPPPRRSGERAKPPRKVDHTYRDFSNYPTDDLPPLSLAPTNFPTKLHHILSDPDYHHVSQSFGSLRISSESQNIVITYSHLLSFSTTSDYFRSSHGWWAIKIKWMRSIISTISSLITNHLVSLFYLTQTRMMIIATWQGMEGAQQGSTRQWGRSKVLWTEQIWILRTSVEWLGI